ncbi:MAG TPA: hypothetical protein VE685_10480 [Thermoanaerobaculia bacterium]|nr:hypothetical protein [Thermoanaerobaculia bacterium]
MEGRERLRRRREQRRLLQRRRPRLRPQDAHAKEWRQRRLLRLELPDRQPGGDCQVVAQHSGQSDRHGRDGVLADGRRSPFTKFYVFDNQGNRINKADLDAAGVKYVPNLCVICHGQNPYPGSAANGLNARFIPFDLDSFQYPTILPFLFSRAAQEGQFKGLNNRILTNTNPTPAITELVHGWYGGAGLPNATQNGAYVVPGWRLNGTGIPPGTSPVDKSALYRDVVKPSCRSCHITRNGTANWSLWDGPGTNDGFKERGATIRSFVCGPNRVMPNARLTYSNFWLSTSPHQPAALGAGGLDFWPAGAPCPQ